MVKHLRSVTSLFVLIAVALCGVALCQTETMVGYLAAVARDASRPTAERCAAISDIGKSGGGEAEKKIALVEIYTSCADQREIRKHTLYTLARLEAASGRPAAGAVDLLPEAERSGAKDLLKELEKDEAIAYVKLCEAEDQLRANYALVFKMMNKEGEFEKARQAAVAACGKCPDNPGVLETALRGALQSFLLEEKGTKGEEVYLKFRLWAESSVPGDAGKMAASYAIARQYDEDGSTMKGISELRDAVAGYKEGKGLFHIHLLLGYLCGKAGDEKTSEEAFAAADKMAGDPWRVAEAKYMHALVRQMLGQSEAASKMLTELQNDYPGTALATNAATLLEQAKASGRVTSLNTR